jgi:hypothetical protein
MSYPIGRIELHHFIHPPRQALGVSGGETLVSVEPL